MVFLRFQRSYHVLPDLRKVLFVVFFVSFGDCLRYFVCPGFSNRVCVCVWVVSSECSLMELFCVPWVFKSFSLGNSCQLLQELRPFGLMSAGCVASFAVFFF